MVDALEILPAELWQIIFGEIQDGQDWLNLYRASPSFQNVVGDKRQQVLLAPVFPHVAKFLKDDLNEMLGLRLVSKQWQEDVDKSLKSSTDGIHHDFSGHEDNYHFEDSAYVSSFLDTFSTHPGGKPFIGNFAKFWLSSENSEEEAAEYVNLVTRLMEQYGSQIKKLYFSASNYNPTIQFFDDFLKLLLNCVTRAPNLEKLHIEFSDDAGVDYPEENSLLSNQQQLPIISKLQVFVFARDGGAPMPSSLIHLQNILVRMCCKPGTLKGAGMIGIPHELAAFPNLEELSWSIPYDYMNEEERPDLALPSWPLSRLQFNADGLVSLRDVVKCVERFKETLAYLDMVQWRKSKRDSQRRLDLPHLKRLTISFRQRNLHLLQNLPNLQVLHVIKGRLSTEEKLTEACQVLEGEIQEFNVWEKLTKIELTGLLRTGDNFCKIYAPEKN